MMKLFEYQGKQLFEKYGVTIPKGKIYERKNDIFEMNYPVVLKAQVPIGGRGKAGGIQLAKNKEELEEKIASILSLTISGYPVHKLLIEEKMSIKKEMYLSIVLDRSNRMPLLMASQKGGVDIENVPDDFIIKEWINPLIGIQSFHIRRILTGLQVDGEIGKEISRVLSGLYQLFRAYDCELVEINPLVQTENNKIIALDAKVIINDDASFRHPDFVPEHVELTELEKDAKEKGISFIQLDGNIGVIANGAGLTMATLDALTHYHGRGGVFLDLGGTDDPQKVQQAFELMKKAKPKVIFLNLFGGITKCDTVAKGVKAVITKEGIHCPVITRIKGMNEDAAKEILKDAGLITATSLQDAAKISSKMAGE